MSKGRAGNMLGVGGTGNTVSRKKMRGGGAVHGGYGPGGSANPAEQKRELLRRLRESRE